MADFAPVDFELGFTRTAQADTAHVTGAPGSATGLAGEVGPGAGKTGQAVFILGQFDLELAFVGVGVLGKDIEDEGRAVNDLDVFTEAALQFAQVARGKLIIEDDHIGKGFFDKGLDLFHFARTDIGIGMRVFEGLRGFTNHIQTSGISQQGQFFQGLFQGEQDFSLRNSTPTRKARWRGGTVGSVFFLVMIIYLFRLSSIWSGEAWLPG